VIEFGVEEYVFELVDPVAEVIGSPVPVASPEAA
jgi:hypothetical protein